MECLIDRRIEHRLAPDRFFYQVRWRNFTSHHDTWVHERDIDHELIEVWLRKREKEEERQRRKLAEAHPLPATRPRGGSACHASDTGEEEGSYAAQTDADSRLLDARSRSLPSLITTLGGGASSSTQLSRPGSPGTPLPPYSPCTPMSPGSPSSPSRPGSLKPFLYVRLTTSQCVNTIQLDRHTRTDISTGIARAVVHEPTTIAKYTTTSGSRVSRTPCCPSIHNRQHKC